MHGTLFRALAVAGLAAPIAFATPVLADPSDGEGCVGLQGRPAAYVCVISVDPGAVPTVTPTGSATVFDESVCYVVGCREVTVTVPTFGVDMPDEPLLVLYYDGETYSIGLTGMPSPPSTDGYVTTVATTIASLADTALGLVPPTDGYVAAVTSFADSAREDVDDIDVVRWADCTVESETDDRVDLVGSSWFSGYDARSCTDAFLLP